MLRVGVVCPLQLRFGENFSFEASSFKGLFACVESVSRRWDKESLDLFLSEHLVALVCRC